ncbi:MAG: RluA family pseudouridine synthase [Planctomycetota bacterium]|nr:RluA family pseudouridine synthase [Planctomycetota bacterium]
MTAGAFFFYSAEVLPKKRILKKRQGQRDMSAGVHKLRYEVGDNEHGARLDVFIACRISWRSRRGVQEWIAEGMVEVLSHKDPQQAPLGAIRDGLKLRTGQEVIVTQVNPAPLPDAPVGPDPGDLEIVFEDKWLVAVNKPPHINVHPSHGHLTGSLIHLVHERHRSVWGETEDMPTLCHRLDRETSGVVLCAKDQLGRTRIGRQFEARSIDKTYLALVEGDVAEESGVIEAALGKDIHAEVRLKMAVVEDGLPSKTEWKVEKRLSGKTLLRVHPLTGWQHQLRVHLASIGHPIVGDKLYFGGDSVFIRGVEGCLTDADRDFLQMDRQALHNWRLEIEHPYTGKRLRLEAPLFQDIILEMD